MDQYDLYFHNSQINQEFEYEPEEGECMKDKIIELLRSTRREGIENLIQHMEEIGFFTAPCSSQYHLCKEGGLAEHSLNVYKYAIKDFESHEHFAKSTTYSEVTIAALLHDLGKAGYEGEPNYIPNILASGKISDKKPFEVNKEIDFDHELISLLTTKQFIKLTKEEQFAICFHNGLYEKSGYKIIGKERPLQLLIHNADMQCSRFIEKGE